MRLAVFATLVLLAAPALLATQEREEVLPGSITVYFPEGVCTASLAGGGPLQIASGDEVSCPPGTYRVHVRHPDYEPFEARIEVRPGAKVVLLPEMRLSREYRYAHAKALLAQKEKVLRTRRRVITAAIVNGALSLVGAGIVGGLEWTLASQKEVLAAEYDRYRTASAADAPGIWANITGITDSINQLRMYETIALSSTGGFLLTGSVLLLLAPSTEPIDREITRLTNTGDD